MAADYAYALVQVAHNVGAVAVVGSPAAAGLWMREQRTVPVVLAWFTASGWMIQIFSGIGFGLTSYLSRGELPEVTGVALFALYLKIGCATTGLALAGFYLLAPLWRREQTQHGLWPSLFFAGIAALSGAAFLRWLG
ncbi:MAG: hypothetical protein HY273_12170 [Gammaproteobacteria bacterium]|nr:hypothetical protein [Gammaproteobacteria bacterium]